MVSTVSKCRLWEARNANLDMRALKNVSAIEDKCHGEVKNRFNKLSDPDKWWWISRY